MARITVLSDSSAPDGLQSEFGLSLWLEYGKERILFDTGASSVFLQNASVMGVDLTSITRVVLSHGHYDHTTGFSHLCLPVECPVHVGVGIDSRCISLHEDGAKHNISLPESTTEKLKKCSVSVTEHFSEIADGIYLTGPIDRISGEDCGGNFYSDDACTVCSSIGEEQALLTRGGTLITGCCHAGIINTVETCLRACPDVPVRTVVGGLHLLHADRTRLERTAAYLNGLNLQKLVLLHCTGVEATEFLKRNVNCEVLTGIVGSHYEVE